jgi:hypothetical protein
MLDRSNGRGSYRLGVGLAANDVPQGRNKVVAPVKKKRKKLYIDTAGRKN